MTRARKRLASDVEKRCPGGNPGRRVVQGDAPAAATGNKQRLEGWDERFVVGFAFVLAAIVVVMAIYQTIAWAHS